MVRPVDQEGFDNMIGSSHSEVPGFGVCPRIRCFLEIRCGEALRMKRRICLWLLIATWMMLCMGIPALGEEAGFLTDGESIDREESQSYIELDGDVVPTIFAAVGRRRIQISSQWRDVEEAGINVRFVYREDGEYRDLVEYGKYLTGLGWKVLSPPTDSNKGMAVYTLPSADGENTLTIRLDYDEAGYVFTATKRAEAVYARDGWKPRTSVMPTPQGLGEPRPLTGEGIPASYRQAGRLDMAEGWIAYSAFGSETTILVGELGGSWREDFRELYTSDWMLGFLLRQEDVLCLLAKGDNGRPTALERLLFDGKTQLILGGTEDGDSYGGPLLELEDGRLLFADQSGTLYICDEDGFSPVPVPGIRTHDFVYHDGYVYFLNLLDQKVYRNVYDQGINRYLDQSFPRLYRARLDGKELTRLTDCGARGLVSQGPLILYQNLDDPYTLPLDEEMSDTSFLYGPVYCYDAATGEHRALGIQSDDYIPTPWGLLVWYHDSSLEPYDIQRADLVFHSYDGVPMYALDAGPGEYMGASCLYGSSLCFYAYNWAYEWEEGQEKALFTVTPLDGGPKTWGIPLSQEGDEEIIPPLVSGRPPSSMHPSPLEKTDAILPSYVLGGEIALQGDRIAYVGRADEQPTLRVLRKQGDSYVPEAVYIAESEISNVVLMGDTVAYLTGPIHWQQEGAMYTLEIGKGGKSVYTMALGPSQKTRPPYAGPLLDLEDGRLLFTDNLGTLYLCGSDGSILQRVAESAGQFVYHQEQVYFENLSDIKEYPRVYCRELGEFLALSYPNLYAVALDGSGPVRLTEKGVRGLVSWGGRIFYQDMGDPFVQPYGELPEHWLCGALTCLEPGRENVQSLGTLSDRYIVTQEGLAVWYGLLEGEESTEEAGQLVLHDWEGNALHLLDAGGELAYAPCAAAGDSLWFVMPPRDWQPGGEYFLRVPLDGSAAEMIIPSLQ